MATQAESSNFYDVLHVSRSAPVEIIRGSYRTMMQQLKHHPDLGGDAATAALINEAYAVLGNPERRAEYDAQLDLLAYAAAGVANDAADEGPLVQTQRIVDPYRECVFCDAPHRHGRIIEADAACTTCGSPLALAESRRMESSDQRAVTRIDKQQNIRFFTHWPQREGYAGHTEDISLSGMRLVTSHDLRTGQCIKIISGVVEAVANVTHCTWSRRRWRTKCIAGVSFVTLRFMRSVGGFVSHHV